MFALAFPIEAPPGAPVFTVEIPAAAYATMTTPDLADLAVVDAEGRPMAISLQRPKLPEPSPLAALPLPMPLALPAEVWADEGGLDLRVARDAAGRLRRLELHEQGPDAVSSPQEWLVDAIDVADGGYAGLQMALAEGTADFRTMVRLSGSDDLVHWVPLGEPQPLLRVSEDGRVVERLVLRFPTVHHRYLALHPEAPLPAFEALRALRQPGPPTPTERVHTLYSNGTTPADAGWATGFTYPSPGPLPVRRVEVRVSGMPSVQAFQLSQRVAESSWVLLEGTAWQFAVNGTALRSEPEPASLKPSGRLQLQLRQPAPAPEIALHYTPEQVVVVASGQPPYRLLAGSAQFRNAPIPLDEAVRSLGAIQGPDWSPPAASALTV